LPKWLPVLLLLLLLLDAGCWMLDAGCCMLLIMMHAEC